jgi:hypothetical protein
MYRDELHPIAINPGRVPVKAVRPYPASTNDRLLPHVLGQVLRQGNLPFTISCLGNILAVYPLGFGPGLSFFDLRPDLLQRLCLSQPLSCSSRA